MAQDGKELQRVNDQREAQWARGEADNYWWMIVRTPANEVHLFELGYAEDIEVSTGEKKDDGSDVTETHKTPMTDERRANAMAMIGAPANAGEADTGYAVTLTPGRPNAYLEPKAYRPTSDGGLELLEMRAKAGVTLHLLTDEDAAAQDGD